MEYKAYIYVITLLLSVFAVSGINIEPLIRKNKVKEAKVLAFLLILSLSYLTANFIIGFLEASVIIKG